MGLRDNINKLRLIGYKLDLVDRNGSVGIIFEQIPKEIETLVIPEGVEFVGSTEEQQDRQYNEGISITKLKLPTTLKTIEVKMFINANKLASVKLPDSIETIDSGAFGICKNLKSVEGLDKVTRIGTSAFASTGLSGDIVFSEDLCLLGEHAFAFSKICSVNFNN